MTITPKLHYRVWRHRDRVHALALVMKRGWPTNIGEHPQKTKREPLLTVWNRIKWSNERGQWIRMHMKFSAMGNRHWSYRRC